MEGKSMIVQGNLRGFSQNLLHVLGYLGNEEDDDK